MTGSVDELAGNRQLPSLVVPPRSDAPIAPLRGLSTAQALRKRAFDVVAATTGLLVLSPVIGLAFVAATIDTTRHWASFVRNESAIAAARFKVVKIRSMRAGSRPSRPR